MMGGFRLTAAILLGTVLSMTRASAQGQPHREPPTRGADPRHAPRAIPPGHAGHDHAAQAKPGAAQKGHSAQPHGAQPHGDSGHVEHAEHDEKAPPPPINWWHGLIGVKEGTEPNLLWRAPGEPPPFLASLLNFGVLVFLVVRFGRKPLAAALTRRKETITHEINEAQRLRTAAEERLKMYEAKLEKISEELERVRREFREQGERDKQRIVAEAKERRERMEKETEIVLGQEAKQMRHDLLAEVVKEASRLATDILAKGTTLGDHDRFAEAFLAQLRSGTQLRPGSGPRGGTTVAGPAAARGSSS
jgi:F-type H+-transporting ATPase subunit b